MKGNFALNTFNASACKNDKVCYEDMVMFWWHAQSFLLRQWSRFHFGSDPCKAANHSNIPRALCLRSAFHLQQIYKNMVHLFVQKRKKTSGIQCMDSCCGSDLWVSEKCSVISHGWLDHWLSGTCLLNLETWHPNKTTYQIGYWREGVHWFIGGK